MIYSGNLQTALRYFDLAWRPDVDGKDEFKREFFSCRLRKSPYWKEIADMNNVEALHPEGNCD
jgi:hypothetical protein